MTAGSLLQYGITPIWPNMCGPASYGETIAEYQINGRVEAANRLATLGAQIEDGHRMMERIS